MQLILYLVTLAGLVPMLTVDTVTIFRHGLNFARCTVACPLLQWIVATIVRQHMVACNIRPLIRLSMLILIIIYTLIILLC